MTDVFISYAREDVAVAERLAAALEARGWEVWWDRDLVAGREFDRVIEDQLTAAAAVLVLFSPRSVESRWVRAEASAAAEREVMIPVVLEGAKVPLPFRTLHAVDLSGWTGELDHDDVDSLVRAVGSLAGPRSGSVSSTPVPPPPPTGPPSWPPPPLAVDDAPAPRPEVTVADEGPPPAPADPELEPIHTWFADLRPPDGSEAAPQPEVVRTPPPEPTPFWKRAWFWGLLAMLAIGAVVAAVLLNQDEGGGGVADTTVAGQDGGDNQGGDQGEPPPPCGDVIQFPCQSGDVKVLEERLVQGGFGTFTPNDIFGEQGEAALVAFEQCRQLTVDGVIQVDGEEWQELARIVDEGVPPPESCVVG